MAIIMTLNKLDKCKIKNLVMEAITIPYFNEFFNLQYHLKIKYNWIPLEIISAASAIFFKSLRDEVLNELK